MIPIQNQFLPLRLMTGIEEDDLKDDNKILEEEGNPDDDDNDDDDHDDDDHEDGDPGE